MKQLSTESAGIRALNPCLVPNTVRVSGCVFSNGDIAVRVNLYDYRYVVEAVAVTLVIKNNIAQLGIRNVSP